MLELIRKNCLTKILAGALFSATLITPLKSFADDKFRPIFNEVAEEMGIDPQKYPLPEINLVQKERLQEQIIKDARKPYETLVKNHGKEKADETLRYCLDKAVTLYNGNEIYIKEGLSFCEQRSKIGRELVHYFQDKEEGTLNEGTDPFGDRKFAREMRAHNIQEKLYRECSNNSEI